MYRDVFQTEKARHLLAVREKINEQKTVQFRDVESYQSLSSPSSTHTKPDKDLNNRLLLQANRSASPKNQADGELSHDVIIDDVQRREDESDSTQSSEQRQHQLTAKCLKLLRQRHFLEMAADAGSSRVSLILLSNKFY